MVDEQPHDRGSLRAAYRHVQRALTALPIAQHVRIGTVEQAARAERRVFQLGPATERIDQVQVGGDVAWLGALLVGRIAQLVELDRQAHRSQAELL